MTDVLEEPVQTLTSVTLAEGSIQRFGNRPKGLDRHGQRRALARLAEVRQRRLDVGHIEDVVGLDDPVAWPTRIRDLRADTEVPLKGQRAAAPLVERGGTVIQDLQDLIHQRGKLLVDRLSHQVELVIQESEPLRNLGRVEQLLDGATKGAQDRQPPGAVQQEPGDSPRVLRRQIGIAVPQMRVPGDKEVRVPDRSRVPEGVVTAVGKQPGGQGERGHSAQALHAHRGKRATVHCASLRALPTRALNARTVRTS